jgi:CHASE2 domain-containing sensor protein
MIQRLQSLYLLFVVILCLILFRGSILSFTDVTGNAVKLMINGSLTGQNGLAARQVANMWPVPAILILISLLSLTAIFLFKNRKIQLTVTIVIIILSAGLITALACYGFNVISNFKMKIAPGLIMAVPLFILVFSVLACRGILKDDRLVKSYDRLR